MADARMLVGTIQSLITAPEPGVPAASSSATALRASEVVSPARSGSLEDDLRALKRLFDDGILTSAEFADLKKKRLGKE
jgi:hypothetical protein